MAHGLMPELTQGCESPALHPGPRHGQEGGRQAEREGWRQAGRKGGLETAAAQPSADPSSRIPIPSRPRRSGMSQSFRGDKQRREQLLPGIPGRSGTHFQTA